MQFVPLLVPLECKNRSLKIIFRASPFKGVTGRFTSLESKFRGFEKMVIRVNLALELVCRGFY